MFNPSSGTDSRELTFAHLSVAVLEANDQIIEPLQVRTFHGSCEFYLVEVTTFGKYGIPDDAGKARKCFTQLIPAL
ncbi:hypothetical protein PISMIDRAFT_678500 [Pisolithus microcarpus 441]|uniref:Uncharacterized protein n=1 Tax=Pisolithus microcarpus 441 TaxID=765257 RepID=A0A0C9YGI7_9AGAM|nr:hypothetical protein PISMIDRAFT_678500 [Pisolithus microcarpus 441]